MSRVIAPGMGTVALVLTLASCTAVTNVDVHYEQCVRPKNAYAETFDGTFGDLLDRCWTAQNGSVTATSFAVENPAGADPGNDELFISPKNGEFWAASKATEPPALLRRVSGDFLVVSVVEAVSTVNSDHCLSDEERAGIVIRREEPYAWAGLFVRPYFDPKSPMPRDQACRDETPNPPPARVTAESEGFGARKAESNDYLEQALGVGVDAEAAVAVCRQNDLLIYFHRNDATPLAPATWKVFHRHAITTEDLDVGLTASGSHEAQPKEPSGMKGAFGWVVVDNPRVFSEGCEVALAGFKEPD